MSEPTTKKSKGSFPDEMEIVLPDDWHHHFRDDARLPVVAKLAGKQFGRAIAMPNLVPPVTTTEHALAYYQRIKEAGAKNEFQCEPLMTLYLTDNTPPEEIVKAKESGKVFACKLYPAGATTNSDSGVTDLDKIVPTLEEMAKQGILLLVHGEVTDQHIDIFDREKEFIDLHLKKLVKRVPNLKVVMEHITTKDAVEFVFSEPNVGATITCHHLLYNRNAIFKGGLNTHKYCLPVLKRETHRQALLGAIKSGDKCFFLGTDSAPHELKSKEASCACAGCFTSHAAVELYAQAFEEVGAMEHFEAFTSFNGPDFYGLERNTKKVKLVRKSWTVENNFELPDGAGTIVPFNKGENVEWVLER